MIKDIYSDPELYDAAHWWKTNDIEFIADFADEFGGPVLELAAGTGRLGLPILKREHTYTGIELSPDFVKCARTKLEPFQSQADFIEGDMRDFDLDRQFQFIFIGFNSIFHLLTNNDIKSFFKCVHAHLADSGTFLIEYMKFITKNLKYRFKDKLDDTRDIDDKFHQWFMPDHRENKWAKDYIYGSEINFNLGTATKVNMILHGDGSTNIFVKDGLLPFKLYDKETAPNFLKQYEPDNLYADKEVNKQFEIGRAHV